MSHWGRETTAVADVVVLLVERNAEEISKHKEKNHWLHGHQPRATKGHACAIGAAQVPRYGLLLLNAAAVRVPMPGRLVDTFSLLHR